MMQRVALVAAVAFMLMQGPAESQGPPALQADCRAVGLFVFDVASQKITAVPSRIEVTFPKPTESAREVCFAWIVVGGDKNDKFEQLVLNKFDDAKGRGGKPLFKAKKMHGPSADFVSLEFNDTPDFDPNQTGVLQDVVESYELEAKFKGKSIVFDPDIIIKKSN